MKIVKYQKLKNNKYKVVLENKEYINLYEDVILRNDLLLKKEITDINEISLDNDKYDLYNLCLKYITIKLRTIKELRNYLEKKDYNLEDINDVITKLINNGYLNDDYYSKCYINDRINLSNDGPNKIRKYLEENNIYEDIYGKYIEVFDDNLEQERIAKYIDKQQKVNKKSLYIFKNKMYMNLINLGYSQSSINSCLNSISLKNEDKLKEIEKNKIYRKLQSKYSGEELEYKVQEKLFQRGFNNK